MDRRDFLSAGMAMAAAAGLTATTDRAAAQGLFGRGRPSLALALGGGSALGWAHIGVLKKIDAYGLKPELVVGTSMGSLVGAAYAMGRLDEAEELARSLNLWDFLPVVGDLSFGGGGVLSGDAAETALRDFFGDVLIEDLPLPFVAVAADLLTNEEVLIGKGSVVAALRASISLPYVFAPVITDNRVLIDGGMKSPVPAGACRAMGARKLVTVDVTGDYSGVTASTPELQPGDAFDAASAQITRLAYVMMSSSIIEAQLAIAKPEVEIVPRLGGHKSFEFTRAAELIALGEEGAEEKRAELLALR
ncbi:patatin-like phospholipase family protein [Oceanomicrobium pacificus]|uniref:Lysophospholipase n=1 Tax=Oceanomicrobium pacificus TaxID=2692916 RepID=A0A6B0TUK0_9RHOB|nr:patatin-like phospholipase family protein [Oceanomicrobium pacificus]MXU65455.1 lysophospholipase [Oceanomicrobium pacificus]